MAASIGHETSASTCSDQLTAFVASRDAPCPVCGYSLRGLLEPRCPECAAPLELQVGSPQLRLGGWVLAIVAYALALGFDGVVALIMAWELLTKSLSRGVIMWKPFGIATLFVVLAAAMLTGMLVTARHKREWQKRTTRAQWLRGSVTFAAVGGLHTLIGLGIMAALMI